MKPKAAVPKDRFAALPEVVDQPLFVYVRMPGELEPLERGERFEDPLTERLAHGHVGEVTGGGSMMSAPDEEGRRQMEYCGIDIDLMKPREGIALLMAELRDLEAPHGTVLQFSLLGVDYEIDIHERTN